MRCQRGGKRAFPGPSSPTPCPLSPVPPQDGGVWDQQRTALSCFPCTCEGAGTQGPSVLRFLVFVKSSIMFYKILITISNT